MKRVMRRDPEQPRTRLGEMVSEAMEAKNISIRDLRDRLDVTYEHARRIAKGEAVPSRFLLREICKYLELNFKEVEKIATEDKIRKKYGEVSLVLAGKDPSLEPVERVWGKLTEDQREDAVTLLREWAKRNKSLSL